MSIKNLELSKQCHKRNTILIWLSQINSKNDIIQTYGVPKSSLYNILKNEKEIGSINLIPTEEENGWTKMCEEENKWIIENIKPPWYPLTIKN